MIPDETKEEIAEAANRGVRTLDAYEQKIRDNFGVSTPVGFLFDSFTGGLALFLHLNYPGLHVAFQVTFLLAAIISFIAACEKCSRIVARCR